MLFLVNVPPVGYCTLDLSQDNNDALVYAVKNHYWYQMYIGRWDFPDVLCCISPKLFFALFIVHVSLHHNFLPKMKFILYKLTGLRMNFTTWDSILEFLMTQAKIKGPHHFSSLQQKIVKLPQGFWLVLVVMDHHLERNLYVLFGEK